MEPRPLAQRNQYGEKKQPITVVMTPTAVSRLDAMGKPPQGFAQQLGISRSELFEQIGRGIIKLQLTDSEQKTA